MDVAGGGGHEEKEEGVDGRSGDGLAGEPEGGRDGKRGGRPGQGHGCAVARAAAIKNK